MLRTQMDGTKMTSVSAGIFDRIVELARDDSSARIKYERAPTPNICLKMTTHHHPWSVTEQEFLHFGDFIRRHNLVSGFELATAFGISGTGAALGFKDTGGSLLTMDAYIEEKFNNAIGYTDLREVNLADPDGLASLRWLMSTFDLQRVVSPTIGWSPDDVPRTVINTIGAQKKFDFVFLDAGHWDNAGINDIAAIRPFVDIKKPFAFFIHDTSEFSEKFFGLFSELYGVPVKKIPGLKETWTMKVATNIT